MSLWAPNLFSGIRVKRFSDDWTRATVELHVNVITRNYVKTAFGGSLSAMTDPYFFMLVMHQLGRDYVVWDTRGEIEFVKPGRGVLTAEFSVSRAKAEELMAWLRTQDFMQAHLSAPPAVYLGLAVWAAAWQAALRPSAK